MATAEQTTQSVASPAARLLTFNLKALARHASEAWGVSVDVPWLQSATGLNLRPVRGWWDVTTERMEFSTIGIWCNLFWCHPHELISWAGVAPAPGAVRRLAVSLENLLGAGPVPPIPVVNHLPAQLASLAESDRSRRSFLREANVSHFAAVDSEATALSRTVLSRICKATGAGVGDMLTVAFPPEANIPPHQPQMIGDLLATTPLFPRLPEDLQRAISELGGRDREILNLRYGLEDGQTRGLRAIAEKVDVSAEAVRQLLGRIRLRLQELAPESGPTLSSYLPEPPPNASAGRARPREKK